MLLSLDGYLGGKPPGQKIANQMQSGIFGYVNYLVERDRKFILDTLLNG